MINFAVLVPVYGKVLDLLVELSAFADPPETTADAAVADLRFMLRQWEGRISETCSAQRNAESETNDLLARIRAEHHKS